MSHWQNYHLRWAGLKAPLRPNSEVIDKVVDLVADRDQRVLLLGVTPELAKAFPVVVAADKSAAMIANIWPGNSEHKVAIEADWLDLCSSPDQFSAVVGDGSCNAVTYPEELRQLFANVAAQLEPGGPFACRIYERPDIVSPSSRLAEEAREPAKINFHAFKWKLAMSIAGETEPSVPVALILSTFEKLFPDRDNLAVRTGWARVDIDTIDSYRNSPVTYCFPSRAEFLSRLPENLVDARVYPVGTYDLAERCPIFFCRRS